MTDRTGLVDALTGLAALSPVSLDELDAHAALLTRRDRKYLVPLGVAERLVGELVDRARVLEIAGRRCFLYESATSTRPGT